MTDDFEVSIFLTETNTRHSLLTKHKHFHDTTQTRLTSNSGRLVGATSEAPIDVDTAELGSVPVRQEDNDDDEDASIALANIPAAHETVAKRPKRARANTTEIEQGGNSDYEVISDDEQEQDEDGLFVDSQGEDGEASPPPLKRRKGAGVSAETEGNNDDDKKKLAMDISYEGFSIYGRVLCLVVKRLDRPNAAISSGSSTTTAARGKGGKAGATGQAMMENFIISTQLPAGAEVPS
jgi:hypothetical protein